MLPLTGFHSYATTVHCKQGEITKAKSETTREKECVPRGTREKERKATAETEGRKKKDL